MTDRLEALGIVLAVLALAIGGGAAGSWALGLVLGVTH
jgi:hypothetical protein